MHVLHYVFLYVCCSQKFKPISEEYANKFQDVEHVFCTHKFVCGSLAWMAIQIDQSENSMQMS